MAGQASPIKLPSHLCSYRYLTSTGVNGEVLVTNSENIKVRRRQSGARPTEPFRSPTFFPLFQPNLESSHLHQSKNDDVP